MFKITITFFATLLLTACGGGSNSSTTPTGPAPAASTPAPTGSSPSTNQYVGIHYLQDLSAAPYAATYIDKGVGVTGSVTFSQPTITATMTPLADGGVAYGAPLNFGIAIGSNPVNPDLPVIAMLCQDINGTGTSGRKSANVLIATSATRLVSAADLAGQSFNTYREDCFQGGSNPPTKFGSFVFDSNGNATVLDQSGTATYSAATVTNALNGIPAYTPALGKYEVIFAYKFIEKNGNTAYALVSHVAPQPSNLTKGDVYLFTQE